ncbi:MAG: tungstate transport system substrate-binding protein [Cellvibrionaceae bacterium]|jgi:tungstate transport system substrate-binding protein
MKNIFFALLAVTLVVSACVAGGDKPAVLRLATTTSTYNSGLLEAILPDFERQFNARVDVIAVGTGQAIKLGESGDADVILVHARSREDQFITDGYGTERFDVMYNDFVIVGPASDPAGIWGVTLAKDALQAIAVAEAPFASRGDDSGTHIKEQNLWVAAGLDSAPAGEWYLSLGQGMGDTLRFANESLAYTLTDRGTFLALQENLPDLKVMVGGANIDANEDRSLFNPYGVIPVDPSKGVNHDLALKFATWLTSDEVQKAISEFGTAEFGQPLFYPDAE